MAPVPTSYRWVKACLSELVGTYLLVTFGPASIILTSTFGFTEPFALGLVAVTFGGTVGGVILVLGGYSGANINPAVTLAVAAAKLLRKELIAPYILFQMAGGLLAGLTLRLIFLPNYLTELGSTRLAGSVGPGLGIAIEAAGTFFLSSSALLATTRIRRPRDQALLVGATLSVLIILIGPLTGAGLNPARSLGPALASGYLSNLYVYFVGPVIGATAAGILFRVRGRPA